VLQADDIGGGSSAACSGRAQVAQGKLDPFNLAIVRDGIARLETLHEELGMGFEFRRNGFLALINSQHYWDEWTARSQTLTKAEIPTEVLDRNALQEAEPHLNIDGYRGAAYAVEGQLNPFLYCWAYANAAQREGATLKPHTPVTKMFIERDRVRAVEAGGSRYSAETIAVMCGAWTGPVLQLASTDLPIHYTHAEAYVTAPVPLVFHNTVQLANFYELIHGQEQAVAVGFHQEEHGGLIVTEAVHTPAQLHTRTSAWGLAGITRDLLKLYPSLSQAQILRAWGIPTPFTPDEEPLVGWVPDRDNLFVAVGFMQTITSVPIVSGWMAEMITGGPVPAELNAYDPARFIINM
jgi:sarcosine oxidase subunit beta